MSGICLGAAAGVMFFFLLPLAVCIYLVCVILSSLLSVVVAGVVYV